MRRSARRSAEGTGTVGLVAAERRGLHMGSSVYAQASASMRVGCSSALTAGVVVAGYCVCAACVGC